MFERLLALISEEDFRKIQDCRVLLVGVGGVGGYALEALVRSGFRNITIVDGDVIAESNLNRQIISKRSNIGEFKVDEAEKRVLEISRDANIKKIKVMLTKDNFNDYINSDFDYIIDACDAIDIKVLLVKYAVSKNIKIVSSLGMAKRLNALDVTLTTLDKTSDCPLAKKMRHDLRKEGMNLNIPVVFSREGVVSTSNEALGSAVFVPAVAGIYLANYVFKDIINK